MRDDAIDVKVNKGLLAFFAEEEGAVGGVVHEEVFGEDGGAVGVAEKVEGGFLVGVAVGVVGVVGTRRFSGEFLGDLFGFCEYEGWRDCAWREGEESSVHS